MSDTPSPTPETGRPAAAGFLFSTMDSAPRTRLQRIRAYRWLLVLAVLTFVFDQASKEWISSHLPLGTYSPYSGAITVIPGFFYLIHVGNTGAAWSMFTGQSLWLALLAIATLAAIFFYRRQLDLSRPVVQIAFGLLCGGITGNLVDRVRHHHVIDFLDFHFGSYVYPTFNLADSGICVGVAIYLIHSLRTPKA